ncbi:hypothetical protein halTADL_1856 [Halohasta litchfieldiae]|jgi:hypothetical protein|uniref:Uncharacterized protein n=1 Tax=Halohasta litchfieldiae TaxID=1073996 RepID=A0A1H6R427_9EURY|nr:hypothetical protein [Halohasta litchfieldiae]ATW88609.1 hypothetical protein halTADL_1856 [Halohasta litchfieldiae]SEI47974.1 hypothetical protein SAMN05444271_101109 [Halohasta litchfieldiae]
MIGTTLSDIRAHIESLASPTGRYYLVCSRTGDRPVPADGLYFDSRPTARAAATATERYRTALRRYDLQLPAHDVIVSERAEAIRSPDDPQYRLPGSVDADTVADPTPACDGDRSLIDFCHTVAGVVFETIADSPHTGVENAIMDRYLSLAETVDHPDECCLRLLEAVACELDSRLTPDQQADLLRAAATELPQPSPPDSGVDPLDAALSALQSVALLDEYTVDTREASCTATTWAVTVDDYLLVSEATRVVTLPLVVELFRRLSTVGLRISAVERRGGSPLMWQFTLTATPTASKGPLSIVTAGRS